MHKAYIIDDDPLKCSWLKPLLIELGSDWQAGFDNPVAALKDADRLLSAASSGPGNVVLLDIYMSGQKEVAGLVVTKLANTTAGVRGDELYAKINDDAYRLACYLYSVCLESRTPVFVISTMTDPGKSIRASEIFGAHSARPTSLGWPDQTGFAAWWRRLLVRLAPTACGGAPTQMRDVFVNHAQTIKAQIDPYSYTNIKWGDFGRSLTVNGPWPCPANNATPFEDGDWHGPTSPGWNALMAVPTVIVQKFNVILNDLCARLPGTRAALPEGTGGVAQYWPVAAAKGIFSSGKISLRLVEWLLGVPASPASTHLDAFRAADDANNAELLSALCMLASSVGPSGERFTIKIEKRPPRAPASLVFIFESTVASGAQTATTELNSSPTVRASVPARRGNPGMATLARSKLEYFTSTNNFRAVAAGNTIRIEGIVPLDNLR